MRKVTQDTISKVLDQYGAFFAFSNKQFEESRKEGVKYVDLGAGLIAPKGTSKKIAAGIEAATKAEVATVKKEKTKKEIIWDAFANYECQITCDISAAVEFLDDFDYGFTKEEIQKEWKGYWNYCVDEDLF